MILYILIIILLIIILVINEYRLSAERQLKRISYFYLARDRAKEINKKFIVIGDPHNGIGSKQWNRVYKPYGCGDVCVDLTGCPKCPNGVKTDVYQYLKTLETDSCVIFISCVLEYIENIEDVLRELKRVTGTNENMFIVSVQKNCLSAYFYYDQNDSSKNIIKGPPEYREIDYEEIKLKKVILTYILILTCVILGYILYKRNRKYKRIKS